MANDITTTTSSPSAFPNGTIVATKDLGGGAQASCVVLTDPTTRAQQLTVDSGGAATAVSPVITPSATFTRPANTTAYVANQLVANNTVAASVVPLSWTAARVAAGSFLIRRARLTKTNLVVTNASYRLHLYDTSPVPVNGDGAAWSTPVSGYLGSIDLDMTGPDVRVFTDVAEVIGAPRVGSEICVKLGSGQTIYGLLQVLAAYTPTSGEVYAVILELMQN